MKLLVVFTGGTIGSLNNSDGYLSPIEEVDSTIVKALREGACDDCEIELISPYRLLSENLTGEYLTRLTDCLFDNQEKGYDGIIVTHGTDTLQYSAAAAHYCLGDCPTPVVFVSANLPTDNEKSNGVINCIGAARFLTQQRQRGVFAAYSNDLKRVDIHLPHRLLRHGEGLDILQSVDGPYAFVEEGALTVCGDKGDTPPPRGRLCFKNDPGILTVFVNPSDSYNYCLDGVNAVILIPYHSGTLNVQSRYFTDFCRRSRARGIPCLLPQSKKQSLYEGMEKYQSLGITVLEDTPVIAATVRLWAELSLKADFECFGS